MDLSTSLIILFVVLLLFLFARFVSACWSANLTDWGKPSLNFLDGMNRLFCEKYHRLPRTDLQLPEHGAAILVSNHLSGLDPLLLIAAARRPLRFLIAKEQYERFGMQWLFQAVGCIPVDRSGKPETAFREALKILKQGEVVSLFPYGGIHLSHEELKLKGGASKLAILSQTDIHAVTIKGIGLPGHVITPVIVRSHARIENLTDIQVEDKTYKDVNEAIKAAL